ncbi:hypothetical protein [Shewanella sp. 10N.286.54.B9]|uniref:hypothetical protein n=1 Tax=Shewanella sp. 10N.286.54.B9 TaxID=3229719 RepID=UPI0035534ADA
MHQSNFSKWALLVFCSIVSLVGIFQFGQLIGLAIFSSDFSVNSIQVWQVGLIGSGIWGGSEFVRTIKKLKASPR